MITQLIRYFARHSKDVTVQTILASLSGLISTFGVAGTIAIILKLRKQKQPVHLANRVKQILNAIANLVLFATGTIAHFLSYRHFIYESLVFLVFTSILISYQRKKK